MTVCAAVAGRFFVAKSPGAIEEGFFVGMCPRAKICACCKGQ
jgi:hypothetical protein